MNKFKIIFNKSTGFRLNKNFYEILNSNNIKLNKKLISTAASFSDEQKNNEKTKYRYSSFWTFGYVAGGIMLGDVSCLEFKSFSIKLGMYATTSSRCNCAATFKS